MTAREVRERAWEKLGENGGWGTAICGFILVFFVKGKLHQEDIEWRKKNRHSRTNEEKKKKTIVSPPIIQNKAAIINMF